MLGIRFGKAIRPLTMAVDGDRTAAQVIDEDVARFAVERVGESTRFEPLTDLARTLMDRDGSALANRMRAVLEEAQRNASKVERIDLASGDHAQLALALETIERRYGKQQSSTIVRAIADHFEKGMSARGSWQPSTQTLTIQSNASDVILRPPGTVSAEQALYGAYVTAHEMRHVRYGDDAYGDSRHVIEGRVDTAATRGARALAEKLGHDTGDGVLAGQGSSADRLERTSRSDAIAHMAGIDVNTAAGLAVFEHLATRHSDPHAFAGELAARIGARGVSENEVAALVHSAYGDAAAFERLRAMTAPS